MTWCSMSNSHAYIYSLRREFQCVSIQIVCFCFVVVAVILDTMSVLNVASVWEYCLNTFLMPRVRRRNLPDSFRILCRPCRSLLWDRYLYQSRLFRLFSFKQSPYLFTWVLSTSISFCRADILSKGLSLSPPLTLSMYSLSSSFQLLNSLFYYLRFSQSIRRSLSFILNSCSRWKMQLSSFLKSSQIYSSSQVMEINLMILVPASMALRTEMFTFCRMMSNLSKTYLRISYTIWDDQYPDLQFTSRLLVSRLVDSRYWLRLVSAWIRKCCRYGWDILNQSDLQLLNIMLTSFSRLLRVTHSFSTKKSHYEILGVSKTASMEDIKKAYYKIAQAYHPDKNKEPGSQAIFSQANMSKTNDQKKREYDGDSRSKPSGWTGGGSSDPFEEFAKDFYKDKGQSFRDEFRTTSRGRRGQDITKNIELNFEEAAIGAKFSLKYERVGTCPTCNGNKCKPGTVPTRCMSCGGSGTTTFRQGSIVMHLPCQKCSGSGLMIKDPCTSCKATGIIKNPVEEVIEAPPGVDNGETITLKDKGNKGEGGLAGDLYINFTVKPHQKYRRRGNDIETTQFLSISQAVLGHKGKIQTLRGTKEIVFPPGCQDGQKITLKNQGIHKIGTLSIGKGDHVIVTRIKIPKSVTQQQKQLFIKLSQMQSKADSEGESKFEGFKNIFR